MEKIVFLDRETLGPSVQITQPNLPHEWVAHRATLTHQVVERLKDATIAITNKVSIQREQLLQLPNLKLIVIAATGYNCVDIASAREQGVVVCNVRGYAMNTVPEHVIALMFALRRNLIGYRQDVINGYWQQAGQFCFHTHSIKDIAGQTLGIIGKGVIGKAVANLATALDMQVQFAGRKGESNPPQGYVPFDEFLATSDFITLHCPLTPETTHLIDEPEFELMQCHPFIINTGRGGLINEAAIVNALQVGQIAGMGFDVVTEEPMPSLHPFQAILQQPNVILTPHVAWASEEAMQTLWNQVITHIQNFAAGKPSNVLT